MRDRRPSLRCYKNKPNNLEVKLSKGHKNQQIRRFKAKKLSEKNKMYKTTLQINMRERERERERE